MVGTGSWEGAGVGAGGWEEGGIAPGHRSRILVRQAQQIILVLVGQ